MKIHCHELQYVSILLSAALESRAAFVAPSRGGFVAASGVGGGVLSPNRALSMLLQPRQVVENISNQLLTPTGFSAVQ